MAMEEHVWCGMISLYPGLQYCARGTIDLRVRNRLWVDLTVVGADVELDALLVTISQINHRFDGSVTIGGPIDVNAMSESVFPSPAVLLAHPYTRNSACKVSDHSIKVELHALGYYFGSWIYVGGVQFPPNHHQDEPANTLSNHEVVETTPTAIGNDLHWR
ncbi:hypothetical protein FOZ61_001007 [Perkinsus olseni]|uniref:Uncharacterized protein n=1 Tax=Perkinsus olseni TaxID=32597 RepID=A0A7J6KSD2_PEROL|nr:hypothetical protein FOZ61_001007 [Perkinsus olseni]KAF4650530.1 hypothetical protein FOL46_000911 [Perkinsus olseni]